MTTVLPSLVVSRRLQQRISFAMLATAWTSKKSVRRLKRDALRLGSALLLITLPGPLHLIFVLVGAALGFVLVGSFLIYNGIAVWIALSIASKQYPLGSQLRAMCVPQNDLTGLGNARVHEYDLSRFDRIKRYAGIVVLDGPGDAFAAVPVELCPPAQLTTLRCAFQRRNNQAGSRSAG